MKVIPAIDIIDGKCVRLTQGDFARKEIYNDDPAYVAAEFERIGFTHLHVVDLDGAKNGKIENWNIIKAVALNTNLNIDFGGGVRTSNDIEQLLKCGVTQVNVGSLAIKNPTMVAEWIKLFGSERIILSADIKDQTVVTDGWKNSTSSSIDVLVSQFMKYKIKYVTCTDVNRDGMMRGPNTSFYKEMIKQFPDIKFTASGGVHSLEDLRDLKRAGAHGAIIGKALYVGELNLDELVREFLC